MYTRLTISKTMKRSNAARPTRAAENERTERPLRARTISLFLSAAFCAAAAGCGGGGGGSTTGTSAGPGGNDPGNTPPVTQPPVTQPPVTQPPVTQPPVDSGTAPSALVLSSKAEYASGGSALIDVALPAGTSGTLTASLNGADVSTAFKSDAANAGHMIGVVTGLRNGANTLTFGYGGKSSTLAVTNYPVTGPIVSGPHMSPFICQTQNFTLPDGSAMGAATDANCSAPTRITYLYRSTAGSALKPLPSTTALPGDVATTTTTAGKTVPFVVRVETATINRGIYQSAVLHDPTKDGTPSPLTPPQGWNRRLIALNGSGCVGGWYIQGSSVGVNPFEGDNLARLAEGYALYANSLNHPSNNCNALVAGESAMMGKEYFTKQYGVPFYTVATGSSGGAYMSLQIADALPGVFDGVFIERSFPDALTLTNAALDAHLLSQYYLTRNNAGLSENQMVAVSGHKTTEAWYDLALQSGRADPVPGRTDPIPASPTLGAYRSAVWDAAVPTALRYHPTNNRGGARPTVFDIARNAYGIDSAGFALRPYDNVGVQYGLAALNAGTITKAQFLDLNERIGGYDADANFVTARNAADAGAVRRAYQGGLLLGGGGGLASVPVFDLGTGYNEDNAYHYQWFHFAWRERIAQANGDARNVVMWRGDPAASSGASAQQLTSQAWSAFIQWMNAYKGDTSAATQRDKVIARKPAAAVDGCFAKSSSLQFIAEAQTFGNGNSQCNQLWPSYSSPRQGAGGDLSASKLKCQLKPVSAADYSVSFDGTEMARLNAIFPAGVCDWSRPGVSQSAVVAYPSFGPSPVNQVFSIGSPG
jgi:hypothetical protein